MASRRIFSSKQRTHAGGKWRLWAGVLGLVVLVWLVGFVGFVHNLPGTPADVPSKADGIVALTGGADRLDVAMSLLTDGKGERLLITGVNGATTRDDLRHRVPDPNNLFETSVDLDKLAQNTVGNALETRRWAASHGYRSLIVVTGQYHMPRSLRELAFVMPNVTLVAYPVVPATLRVGAWWYNPGTFGLLADEYMKYLASGLRIRLTKTLTPTH